MKIYFECDDVPYDFEFMLEQLDKMKFLNSTFKGTLFAIPSEMKVEHWRELIKRQNWLRVGMHGFLHIKGECRDYNLTVEDYFNKILRVIETTSLYSDYFRAPWDGLNPICVEALRRCHKIIFIRDLIDLTGLQNFRFVKVKITDLKFTGKIGVVCGDNMSRLYTHTGIKVRKTLLDCVEKIKQEEDLEFGWSEEKIEWI